MFPRKAGSKWEIWTPAKLNLYLEVLGRQESGYHELETLMTPVCLYDHLRWSPASGAEISASPTELAFRLMPSSLWLSDGLGSGNLRAMADASVRRQSRLEPSGVGQSGMRRSAGPDSSAGTGSIVYGQRDLLPRGEDNLVLRAARLLACRAGVEPYGTLTLRKRIPISAGMGGGSSDAAATLVLASKAWGIDYPVSILFELAAELGSDVPFFLARGMAVCRGRGERIESVRSPGRLHFVVVKPPMGFSTAEMFAQVARNTIPENRVLESRKRLSKLIEALRSGALSEGVQWMTNRLEEVAASMSDWSARMRKAMAESGCCGQWMTGSGSAYVGLVRTAKQANHVRGVLASRRLGAVFVTSSC